MTERYDNLLIRQRLCREALAGPLGYWERAECLETLERIEREINLLGAPAFTEESDERQPSEASAAEGQQAGRHQQEA